MWHMSRTWGHQKDWQSRLMFWLLPGVHPPAGSCHHSTVPTATSNTNQGLHLKHIFILLFSSNSFVLCLLKVKYMTDWKFTKLTLPLRTFEM